MRQPRVLHRVTPESYLFCGEAGPTEINCDFRDGMATSRDFGVWYEGDLVRDRHPDVRHDGCSSSHL